MQLKAIDSLSPATFARRTISAQIHLGGLILALCLSANLIVTLPPLGFRGSLVVGLYLVCSVLVFGVSSVYHFWHDGYGMSEEVSRFFEHLDHATIYVFIASCYTALFFYTVDSVWGLRLIAATWIYAACGIAYTLARHALPRFLQHRYIYTASFAILGWIALVRAREVVAALNTRELLLFVVGSVAYTLGAVIYAMKLNWLRSRLLGYHEVWHLLVVLGWIAHFGMIQLLIK